MKLKTFLCTFLSALVLFIVPSSQAVAVNAFDNQASPMYAIAFDARSNLTIDGTRANCQSYARGEDAVKITATQTLQKNVFLFYWSDYDNASWTKTIQSNIFTMYNTKTITSGTYRLKTVFTLTDKSGETETITVYSQVQTLE